MTTRAIILLIIGLLLICNGYVTIGIILAVMLPASIFIIVFDAWIETKLFDLKKWLEK